ncbi:hypothetical protein L1887_23681 [Cichorium endivia]|nr:hypothetical protein L1887_23681 [Cichorium endivia]
MGRSLPDRNPKIRDSERKVEKFLALPREDMTFKIVVEDSKEHNTIPFLSELLYSTMMLTRSISKLGFSNVEDVIFNVPKLKVERPPPAATPRKSDTKIDNPDPKNRKELIDVYDDIFKGLGPFDVKRKLVSQTQA